MKAFTQRQREAIQKAKIKQAMKKAREAAEKIKHAKKKAEKARYEAQCPSGSREVEVEAAWEQRSSDKLPQIRGTDGKLPIKLGGEGGVVFWKLDKKRLENFIQCERDPKMTQRYKLILKEAKKLKLVC